MTTSFETAVAELERQWASEPRWQSVERPYSAADVVRTMASDAEDTLRRILQET